jgi:putative membrane protein insertion efficiency factor
LKPITSIPSNGASARGDSDHPLARLPLIVALALLKGYKLLISPYFRGSCRFLPSCADYATEALTRHGVIRGTWLAARRLVRCHPLCEGGYDAVPMRNLD